MKSFLTIILSIMLLLAQPVLADNCGVGPPCSGDPDATWEIPGVTCCVVPVPFDGGVTLMLAAGGIGMGITVMRKRKRAS